PGRVVEVAGNVPHQEPQQRYAAEDDRRDRDEQHACRAERGGGHRNLLCRRGPQYWIASLSSQAGMVRGTIGAKCRAVRGRYGLRGKTPEREVGDRKSVG